MDARRCRLVGQGVAWRWEDRLRCILVDSRLSMRRPEKHLEELVYRRHLLHRRSNGHSTAARWQIHLSQYLLSRFGTTTEARECGDYFAWPRRIPFAGAGKRRRSSALMASTTVSRGAEASTTFHVIGPVS